MALYAFDGTWKSDLHGPRRQTNVLKFYNAYDGEKFYFRGIGNKHDHGALMQIIGGVSGFGGKSIVMKAYEKVARRLEEGDDGPIDIVGFSRGAALAVHFANALEKRGIPILSTRRRVVKKRARAGRKRSRTTWRNEYDYHKPLQPVRFLGLWDAVASFGIPGNDVNLGYDLRAPKGVKRACHAMALDEERKSFQVTRFGAVVEAWFMGRHANVGGGHPDPGLSDITLNWVMKQARKASLSFDQARVQEIKPDPTGTMPDAKGGAPNREVSPGDRVHTSVIKGNYAHLDWGSVKRMS